METVWNDLNGAERLNDWNDWNWLLSKIDRAIDTIFCRLINGLRGSDLVQASATSTKPYAFGYVGTISGR